MANEISPDYLVIGAGAMAMAFVDTLITDTKATVAIADRYARPGGHWTIAYPFVRLHQPSAFYGVNSRPLGEDKIDQIGWNKGMYELATVDEVCAYFSKVMHQTFLSSGRVEYYPKHEYVGEGEFKSIVTNKAIRVGKDTRIVDATFMKVKVPAMCPPAYQVSQDVRLITPNDLPKISRPYAGYTVVGAGKTGIDACLWLIAHGVDPKEITWITPRDAWLYDRSFLQPDPASADKFAQVNEAIAAASSPDDLFKRLEACGHLMRVDKQVQPTMFRCATVSVPELEQIKRIGNIVRQGRVIRVDADKVVLQKGEYKSRPDTLYIDCTADALAKLDPVPVFSGRNITLQSVRHCQQVFSAAFIAHVEATYEDEKTKNDLCRTIPHPNEVMDYLVTIIQSYQNGLRWGSQPQTAAWLTQARLNMMGRLQPAVPTNPAEAAAFFMKVVAMIHGVSAKLRQLIDMLPEEEAARAKAQLVEF